MDNSDIPQLCCVPSGEHHCLSIESGYSSHAIIRLLLFGVESQRSELGDRRYITNYYDWLINWG